MKAKFFLQDFLCFLKVQQFTKFLQVSQLFTSFPQFTKILQVSMFPKIIKNDKIETKFYKVENDRNGTKKVISRSVKL